MSFDSIPPQNLLNYYEDSNPFNYYKNYNPSNYYEQDSPFSYYEQDESFMPYEQDESFINTAQDEMLSGFESAIASRGNDFLAFVKAMHYQNIASYIGKLFSHLEYSHVAIAVAIVLFTVLLGTFMAGKILDLLLRSPLQTFVGICYKQIEFSPLRFLIIMNDLEWRPSDSHLAKTVMTIIFPSADVVTKAPDLVEIMRKFNDPDEELSAEDILSLSFHGSNITAASLSLKVSFRLTGFGFFKSMPESPIDENFRSATAVGGADDIDLETGVNFTGIPTDNGNAGTPDTKDNQSKNISRWLFRNLRQKLNIRQWIGLLNYFGPYPIIDIKLDGLSIEIDKTYIAPDAPKSLLRNLPRASSDIEDSATRKPVPLLPAAVVKSSEYAPKRLPTFDQDYVLSFVNEDEITVANSRTYFIERWLERSGAGVQVKSKENKDTSSAEDSAIDAKSRENAIEDLKQAEERTNNIIRSGFMLLLRACKAKITDAVVSISGADSDSIKLARSTMTPQRAALCLAGCTRSQRAMTVLSADVLTLSFREDTDCTAVLGVGGLSLNVGLPDEGDNRTTYQNSPGSENIDEFRNWHEVVSPFDAVVEFSGLLPLLVYLISYDHMWEKRSMKLTLTLPEISVSVSPQHILTTLAHLDDFIDPYAPYNEWVQWLSLCRLLSKTLTDKELAVYRASYKKLKGKEDKDKNEGQTNQPVSSTPASQGTSSDDNPILSAAAQAHELERYMNRKEIMEQRCIAMKRIWIVPKSSTELESFLKATNSHVSWEGKRLYKRPGDKFSQDTGLLAKKEYRSALFALESFMRHKFDILAPQFSLLINADKFHVHIPVPHHADAENVAEKNVVHFSDEVARSDPSLEPKEPPAHDDVSASSNIPDMKNFSTSPLPTTFHLMGISFACKLRNPIFANIGMRMNPSVVPEPKMDSIGEPLLIFQDVEMEIADVTWQLDEDAVVDSVWPKFDDGFSCGILYMHPSKKPNSPSVNLNFQWAVTSVDSEDVHIIGNVTMGDFLFVVNPIPLLTLVEMLDGLSNMPFRDLPNEQQMLEPLFPERLSTAVDLFFSDYYTESIGIIRDSASTHSDGNSIDKTLKKKTDGTLLNGLNILLEVTISNVSMYFLCDMSLVDKGGIELNVGSLSIMLDSGKDLEQYLFSARSLVLQARMLRHYDEGLIKLLDVPLKRAAGVGSVKVCARARSFLQSEDDARRNEKQPSHRVSVEVSSFIDSITVSFSSTTNALLIRCFQSYEEYIFGSPEDRAMRQKLEDDKREKEYKQQKQAQEVHFEALNQMVLKFDKDKSLSLDAKEIEAIVRHFFTHGQSKAGTLTDAELMREVRYFLQSLNPNAHTDEIGYHEMNYVLASHFMNQKYCSNYNNSTRDELFFANQRRGGLVYYDDMREFSSTKEVFRITGRSDSSDFLPTAAWHQGQGVALFWKLYQKETGCTRTSLCGQDTSTVQRKLVRLLCNYNFAKFCWKSLVKPGLQDGPIGEETESSLLTDWLLDKKTGLSQEKEGFVGLLNKRLDEGSLVMDQKDRQFAGSDDPPLLYAVSILFEVDDITLSIGDSIATTASLFDLQMSGVNVCGNALLNFVSGEGIVFAPFFEDMQVASSEELNAKSIIQRDNDSHLLNSTAKKLSSQSDTNKLHFESRLSAHYLMTKHNTMETFMERFTIFGGIHYGIGINSPEANSDQDMDVRSFSFRLLCPHVLNMNGSPSCFETFNLIRDIISHSHPDVNTEMGGEEQIENMKNFWRLNNKPLSENFDADDFLIAIKRYVEHQARFRQPAISDGEINEVALGLTRRIDPDINGEISFASIEHAIRSEGVIVSFFDDSIRYDIKNTIGEDLRICSRDFLDAHMNLHPNAPYMEVLSLFDSVPNHHTNTVILKVDQSKKPKSHQTQLILFVQSFRPVYDISISAYQSFMILLKPAKTIRRRRRAVLQNGAKSVNSAAGFDPYLAILPLPTKLDSMAFEVRTCLILDASTSVNVRIVDLGPSPKYLRRRRKGKGKPVVDLMQKNLRFCLAQAVDDAPIIFESHNLQQGSHMPVPFHIINSSSYHALLVQDLTGVNVDVWRSPILLTKDFLFNSTRNNQVSQCHAASGISIKRDRLNVHLPEKKVRKDKNGRKKGHRVSKRKTAWDTTIEILPSVMILNALPFSVQFRCWQMPKHDENIWTNREYSKNSSSSDDDDEDAAQQDSLRSNRRLADRRHRADGTIHNSFLASDHLLKGSTSRLNGIDMNASLYIQISHAFKAEKRNDRGGLSELVWTEPMCIDLKELRTEGNKKGTFSLPKIRTHLGDDADLSLDVTIDRDGTPTCTLFAPYWVINKTGIKMSLKFTGRPKTVHCSGCGGIPIIADCWGKRAEKKISTFNKKEISALPIESFSEQVTSVWWDEAANGKLVLEPPLLKQGGKSLVDWSQGVNIDAVGTQGEINCKDLIFGVSIDPLTGIYHRSHLVTFSPRYIVKNLLLYPIKIIPMYGFLHNVEKITKSLARNKLKDYPDAMNLKDHIMILQPGESTILCQFMNASRVAQALSAPSTTTAQTKKKKLRNQQIMRMVCVQIDAPRWTNKEKWHLVLADIFDLTNYCDRDGMFDRISWMMKAQVQKIGPSTVVSILPVTIDPFRIENRSSHQFLQFAQEDEESSVIELPPMTFCGYTWDNPHGKKRLRFVVVDEYKSQQYLMERRRNRVTTQAKIRDGLTPSRVQGKNKPAATKAPPDDEEAFYIDAHGSGPPFIRKNRLFSPGSHSYNPLDVGRKARLPFSHRGHIGHLIADVKIVAGSRIFSFYDSSWRSEQFELGIVQSGGDWKNTSIEFAAEGAAFHLVDDFPREICSVVARELMMYKAKGSIETAIILRSVQIDAMLSSARYPIILQQVPIGIDRREYLIKDFKLPDEVYFSGNRSLTRKNQFWLQYDEVPCPVFECRFSFMPQNNMTWIPNIKIELSPMKIQIELEYVLRIVDLILNAIPTMNSDHAIEADAIEKVEEVNERIKYQTRSQGDHLAYVQRILITPVQVQLNLDIKPETKGGDIDEDDVEAQPIIELSSMGKSTNSSVASGVLSWVTNVSSVFAHVSPTFSFKEVSRLDCYCHVEELLDEIARYYIMQTILQSYKVLFSMRILGDPTKLLEGYRTGLVDVVAVTKDEVDSKGKEGVGKGVTSFFTNVFGGTFLFFGKFTGSLAELLDSLATNEYSSDAYKPKNATASKPPEHVVDGLTQGAMFASKAVISGIAGLVGNPYRGMKEGSMVATAKGAYSGIAGAGACLFVGALGFVAKTTEGVGETINMLELSVIESRCRPTRMVTWGSSIGLSGLPHLKAIGIRVHGVRYQRKRRQAVKTDEKSELNDTREFKKAKAEEEKRRNPKRKVMSITRVRDKFHHLTRSVKPTLLEDEEEKPASSKVSRYVVIFEETIVIRCDDLQLSDHIVLNLWNYSAIKKLTTKTKPISVCHLTVGDLYVSMEHFYRGKLKQTEMNLTHQTNIAERTSNNSVESSSSFMSKDILSDMAKMRAGKTTASSEGAKDREGTILAPCVQEFAMMRPTSKVKDRNHEGINDVIQAELTSIQKAEEEALEFFDSDSSYSSDSSFSLDGRPRRKEVVDLEEVSRQMEHLHGTATLSFFPIVW